MWIKEIVLDIEDPNGTSVFKLNSNLRMDFTYRGTGGGDAADTCSVDIYNLSKDNVKSLVDLSGIDGTKITLRAGYKDEIAQGGEHPVIVHGVMINVSGRRELPNHITTLYIVPDVARRLCADIVSVEYRGPSTYKEFINFLIGVCGLKGQDSDWDAVPYDIRDAIVRNQSDKDSKYNILRKFTRESGLMVDIHGEIVRLSPAVNHETSLQRMIDTGTPVHRIVPELMRGVPTVETCAIDIPYNLSPELRVFGLIAPDRLFGERQRLPTGGTARVGGEVLFRSPDIYKYMIYPTYQIIELVHTGSNYTDAWNTNLKCVAYASKITDQVSRVQYNDKQGGD